MILDFRVKEVLLPFGGEQPGPTQRLDALLSAGGNLTHAEQVLRSTLESDPDAFAAYFALYKLLFRQSRLVEAEAVVRNALAAASRQGGFDLNWQNHAAGSAPWSTVNSPAHFYLFSLKALSFILLRQGRMAECRMILDKIEELDPGDLIGASVIRAYADGAASA
ncbi:MAG: hypothetical protein ACYDCX_11285 [Acidithiobacillus sp.]